MDPIHPDYLFSICGLTTKSIDEVRDTVLQVWKGQAAQDFILSLRQTTPDPLLQQASATLQNVTKSLEITMLDTKNLGGASAPSFNIYIQAHLIPDDGLWCRLCNFFASQEYALPFQQPGHAGANFFHCTICHSIDHPRGLCVRLKLAFCTTCAVRVLVLAQGPSFLRLRRALLGRRGDSQDKRNAMITSGGVETIQRSCSTSTKENEVVW